MKIEKANKPLGLSSPQVRFANIVQALFSKDPEVQVTTNFDAPEETPDSNLSIQDSKSSYIEDLGYKYWIKFESVNYSKLLAIRELFGTRKDIGNIKIHIFYTHNGYDVELSAWEEAFKGNPIFKEVISKDDVLPTHDSIKYAVFSRDIISFFNDDFTSYDGCANLLIADAVREVIDLKDIHPCTESRDK